MTFFPRNEASVASLGPVATFLALPAFAFALLLAACLGLGAPHAEAGIFNLPHFVQPGDFAIGLEPELVFTNGAGVGINARYTHGLTDLNNVMAILGSGTGPREFRVGGAFTFDFFPDIEGQPGVGLAAQGLYVRVPTPGRADLSDDMTGRVELTGIPYIHKAFVTQGHEVEPYLAIPWGMSFTDGQYKVMTSVVVGSMFKTSERIRTSVEFGVAVNHSESYLSAGVAYYH